VVLTLAEFENYIGGKNGDKDEDIIETVYTFHFQNTADTNQEVVFKFRSPTVDTVMT